jgi:antitoxin YefM
MFLYMSEEAIDVTETTYTQARANFAALCDEVTSTREPVIIRRRGSEDVALVAADELRGLLETAYLLRSPNNARRLFTALDRSETGSLSAVSVESLRREVGLGEDSEQ